MKRWLAVLLALLMLCVLCGCKDNASVNHYTKTENEEEKNTDGWDYDASRGYFMNENAAPQMSAEGLKADVFEAYFTKSGYLCVVLKIGNGTAKEQNVVALDVALYDAESDDLIGGGIAEPEEELKVAAGDTLDYAVYISPEHVEWAKGKMLPDTLSFEISIDHTPVEKK